MKTNPNHPITQCRHKDGSVMTRSSFVEHGSADDFYVLCLTKREHFAAMALSGCQGYEYKGCESPADVASRAVEIADALIAALNKEEQ